jgi:hypothetical protein
MEKVDQWRRYQWKLLMGLGIVYFEVSEHFMLLRPLGII